MAEPKKNEQGAEAARDKVIVRTSIIGIFTNVLLAAFKAVVGVITHSIAITMDAVNNLSDALSSIVTIIGTKLATRRPDRKHPLGHGRVEYLSAAIVAAIVLFAGITSLQASVQKILHPEKPDYTHTALLILAVAVVVKILLGRFVKRQGERVHSGALVASGADALFDAILSLSVLGSAILYLATGLSLEAFVGAAIAVYIIKSGIEMLRDTIDDILGRRADPEMTKRIKGILTEFPEVRGAYDLFLNNYGPDREYASVHLELPDTMTVEEVDVLTRKAQEKVFRETGVVLTGVGVYSYNTKDEEAAKIRNTVQHLVMDHPWALQMHAFHADTKNKQMRFDVVLSFDIPSSEALEILQKECKEAYPDYEVSIIADVDIS